MPEPISSAMMSWYRAKVFVEHAIFFSSDALHMIAGVIAWLLLALALRKPISHWMPWFGLLVLLLANEAIDLWVERWPDPAMQYGESAKDILLTMTLPAVLMFAARLRPQLFRRRRRGSGAKAR